METLLGFLPWLLGGAALLGGGALLVSFNPENNTFTITHYCIAGANRIACPVELPVNERITISNVGRGTPPELDRDALISALQRSDAFKQLLRRPAAAGETLAQVSPPLSTPVIENPAAFLG